MFALAAPMVLAEDSSDAISLYDDTSNLSEGMVISPASEVTSEETETELELNEDVGEGKIAWKQFRLWFTFNQETKAQGELELARLRLIQAKVAAQNNNSVAMEKALEAHERIMNRVKTRVNASTKLVGLERAIQVHERRIAYMTNVLETANLSDVQKARIETKLEAMKQNSEDLTALQERKMEQIKERLASNNDSDEPEEETEDSEDSEDNETESESEDSNAEDDETEINESEENNQEQNQAGQQ